MADEKSFNSDLSPDDLRLLFESSPDQDLVLDADFRIVSASRAYLKRAGRSIDALVGQSVFEAFPNNPNDPPDGSKVLKASLERVLKTKHPDRLQPFRYDVQTSDERRSDFTERYWAPLNTPILDSSGNVRFIVHRVYEVTSTMKLQKQNLDFSERLKYQDTELLLRVVADRLPAFVSYMGADHRFKFVNAIYSRWFGLPASEIEGKSREELVGADTNTDDLLAFEHRAFAGEPCAFELTLTKPNREFLNLDIEYIPDVDPKTGQVRGIVAIGQDVTARKAAFQESQSARHELEISESRFRSLSDSLPILMWTWRQGSGVSYINQRALAYLGIKGAAEFAEAFINALDTGEGLAAQKAWYTGIAGEQFFKVEARIRGSDGKFRWFLNQVTPIRKLTGEIDYWIATATDIDEERRIAQELFKAKNAAEDANRAKTEFLANMSHEIRTPLNAILGFSDLLRDDSLTPAARDQYGTTITRNGRLLTRIIDDILDLAKVESGRMEAEEVAFSLPEIVNEVLALFSDGARQKGITLKSELAPDVPVWIASDPTRLRQILINVIGNAVKFTDVGFVETKVAASSAGEKTQITIRVSDTGRGIPQAQRDRLFKPFTQADNSTTRRYGGTGLGLALSRRLAEALGGTLVLDDSPRNEGASFVITFFAKLATEKAAAPKTPETSTVAGGSAHPLRGLRVLVVDDSLDNQSLINHILTKLGAEVDVANNGREGVQRALAKAHDVVLMDIQMPDMDGYQAMAALKQAGFKTPVIALTAHALTEERAKTKAAGFSNHLTKPIDKSALIETLTTFRH